jgi:hypothetical protein
MHIATRNRHPPSCQGDTGLGILWLQAADVCGSRRGAGGDWEGGIYEMHVAPTDCDPPHRNNDSR